MVMEVWFYVATVLLCTVFPLLLHSHPDWKIYFIIAFGGFIICGGVLVYLHAKEDEEGQTKIAKLERDLEEARKETQRQKAAAHDAAQTVDVLAQQLKEKTQEIHTALKEQPQVDGQIRDVRLFPWQRQSAAQTTHDETVSAIGIVVFANVENHGSSTRSRIGS
jgi:hypothetical protein